MIVRSSKYVFISLGLVLALGGLLRAQPAGDTLYTVGTSHEDEESGEHAAYVLWEASERELMDGLAFDVYQKPGGPDAAGEYKHAGTASYQTDGYTIAGILDRARAVGEDLALLESRIDEMFGDVISTGSDLPLREKLANVMLLAQDDEPVYENLLLLSRVHPGVAMAMGKAWALPAEEGERTFEIRQVGSGDSVNVVGRVTVEVGRPRVLPPPDAPHALSEPSSRGHLNARLIWGTPDELNRLGLLQYGYDLYRIDREFAEEQGFDSEPPEPGLVRMLAADHGEVVRVNNLPIVPGEEISNSEAAAIANDPKETDTFFFGDDNGSRHGGDQFPNGGEAFEAGSEYYYYVAALDVLGKPGELSNGRLVTICDRMPPPPAENVQVENTFTYDSDDDERLHALEITWDPPEGENSDDVENYYVYRFETTEEIQTAMAEDYATPDNEIAGPIHHMEERRFVDEEIADPSEYGNRYYYTVRAEDDSVCQRNLSGHGAPASGVLRDREGPDAPSLGVTAQSGELKVMQDSEERWEIVPVKEEVPGKDLVEFVCKRRDPEVAWAEFEIDDEVVGRVYFGDRDSVTLLATHRAGDALALTCRAGAPGFEPDEATLVLDDHQEVEEGYALRMPFEARASVSEMDATLPGVRHQPVDPATGQVQCVDLGIRLEPGSREYKVYRRTDDGDRVLVDQGVQDAGENDSVSVSDCTMPAVGGDYCYSVQAFDENGNASAMSETVCVEVLGTGDLPVPMLATPVGVEKEGQSYARLSWFSSPNGVDRFEVLVAPVDDMPEEGGDDFSGPFATEFFPDGDGEEHQVFQTGRVGSNLTSDGGAGFTANFPVRQGETYAFVIRAVGEGDFDSRAKGDFSNSQQFYWKAEEDEDLAADEVPWPQETPPEADSARDELAPRLLLEDIDLFVGIPIGEFLLNDDEGQPYQLAEYEAPFPIPEEHPEGLLTEAGEVLPVVLYRYQVDDAPAAEAEAVGDLVQVTPLLEEIAFEESADPARYRDESRNFHDQTPREINVIHDPFILGADLEEPSATATHGLYIRDTQPAMNGARYRYLLVQFDPESGEIDNVIPTPAIRIVHPEISNP